jgi:hypothetical protein
LPLLRLANGARGFHLFVCPGDAMKPLQRRDFFAARFNAPADFS